MSVTLEALGRSRANIAPMVTMTPLIVTARLRGAVALPHGPIALDGLLAYAVCVRDGILPALTAAELVQIDIPVAREAGGRFHLATGCTFVVDAHENRWVNRRFPIAEAQVMGDDNLRRIQINAGAQKSYRLPLASMHLIDDTMTWWCIGARDEVCSLVNLIGYLGKRRSVGLGTVREWSVVPCDPWGDGFPLIRNGQPMRPLPVDWPGLAQGAARAYRTITYPYWRRDAEELLAVPAWA